MGGVRRKLTEEAAKKAAAEAEEKARKEERFSFARELRDVGITDHNEIAERAKLSLADVELARQEEPAAI